MAQWLQHFAGMQETQGLIPSGKTGHNGAVIISVISAQEKKKEKKKRTVFRERALGVRKNDRIK